MNINPRLRTEAAAKYLNLSVSSLAKMRVYGNGPAYSKLGRVCVYSVTDLEAWLDSKRHLSTSEYGSDQSLSKN